MSEVFPAFSNRNIPEANESLLGEKTLVVSCNHGRSRQFELAENVQAVVKQLGKNLTVCTLPGGWSGVISTIYTKENQVDSSAYLFFEQIKRGGIVITASHDGYKYFLAQLQLRGVSERASQVIYMGAYSTAEEITTILKENNIF